MIHCTANGNEISVSITKKFNGIAILLAGSVNEYVMNQLLSDFSANYVCDILKY